MDNSLEMLPITDEEGNIIGSATRGECHDGSMLLHPVVHLHLFDSKGRIYLQKRPGWKEIQPGKWDTAVGGHVSPGESPVEALMREAGEEIGLSGFDPQFIRKYIFRSDRERELVYAFRTVTDSEPTPSDELDGGRFWEPSEIESAIGKGILTPNFESEYQMLFSKST